MIIIENKTIARLIYTLKDGTTLRLTSLAKSEPLEESNLSEHVLRDIEKGDLAMGKVNSSNGNKGGKN